MNLKTDAAVGVDQNSRVRQVAVQMVVLSVKDLLGKRSRRSQEAMQNKKSAFWWIFQDEAEEAPSFFWCCTVLGLSVGRMRRLTTELLEERSTELNIAA